ncbi:uncharacterized protein RCC_12050 [Ramularia collo-cygni]|uniref:Berberine/berberine-like domain-containing protein n=1 Tax=Ramularia collo-cygni TaxID=112498 RepID=A0A2D3UTP4_9PEZI|nr:uncharacterized protein RCC_12050 [Ramularia collo-cygni]CZT15227.1 uncharacterized protein RCC_12050 [Ramularia collo-cygni]
MLLAWMSCVYGEEPTFRTARAMEYVRQLDSYYDPFAKMYNVTAPEGAL